MAKAKPQDALIGKRVRINADLADGMSGEPHMWAGREGEVLTRNETGSYQVAIGDAVKVFDMSDFSVLDATGAAPSAMVEVPPALAVNSLTNPRRRKGLDMDSLTALASSIKVHSLGQPILVRPLPGARLIDTADMEPRPIYEVIAGERRWRACQIAGLDSMPMLVREMSDEAVLEMQLVENIEREDLDDMEEAEGFEKLRQKLGYTVEQIADRIGKGKGPSYVYKALKLCALTPESREAMYPGPEGQPAILNRSTGLLVARYKPEQQAEVVEFIASLAIDGEQAPFRKVQADLAKRFHLVLGQAPFDVANADLVPAAGACTACPKRSGNQGEIFGDHTGPDSCTDPDCFDSKREAHVVLIKVNAQQNGLKVIDGEDARRARPTPGGKSLIGYVKLDDIAYTQKGNDDKERAVTFGDALRALGKKAPKPRLLIDHHTSEATQVITIELANKLVPEDDPSRTGPCSPAPKSKKSGPGPAARPPEELALDNRHVERAVLLRIFDAIRAGERTTEEMRLIAKALFVLCENHGDTILSQTERYLGWEAELDDQDNDDALRIVGEKIDAMLPEQLGQLLAMAAAEITLNTFSTTSEQEVALAQSYGVDILAVQAKVAEDLERQAAKPLEKEAEAGA